MGYLELDLDISGEAKAMHETAKEFAMKVMRPAGIELDKMGGPADVIAEGSVLWGVIKGCRELDLHRATIPKESGGWPRTCTRRRVR